MTLNMRTMVGKLTIAARRGLEDAAGLALMRGNYDVEPEHWFLKLMEVPGGDMDRIMTHFGIATSRVSKELLAAIDAYKCGNGGRPQIAPDVERILRESWGYASINYDADRIRSGVLLLTAVTDQHLRRRSLESMPSLRSIDAEVLSRELAGILAGSEEDAQWQTQGGIAGSQERSLDTDGEKSTNLDKFTIDLTAAATAGSIDPVLGRDAEIRQIIDILMRRRQNNPILTGEAGVGKTAVVEGFALRVSSGDVPSPLRDVQIRTLDLGLLQAGAGVKGEFENRLKGVIQEVKASPKPIILFIDEAHTLVGAGGQEGQNDAANLLKPALARGELRTIAATTWAEYKRFFEKDAALSRRFQVVKVEEPDTASAIEMMRGLVPKLEMHHGVRVLDSAVRQSVVLSQRYLTDRQLPDKSVSVLDTACARVAIGMQTEPALIEGMRRRLDSRQREAAILEREQVLGADHAEQLKSISSAMVVINAELAAASEHWARERDLVERILAARAILEHEGDAIEGRNEPGAANEAGANGEIAQRAELPALCGQLAALQGETSMVRYEVDSQTIAEVIAGWTGIPVGRMVSDEIQSILNLSASLRERIIGQDRALDTIAERVRTSRANLDRPGRPVGVFLLVGPSGVGKTETANVLAEQIFGGQRNLVTINMSEYQEAHTVSGLKGAPPGYVGYGEGGVLTEAVRRRPYAVILLDEVEKAHTDVMELFYQVFDKGVLEDGEGREIDFRNTVILMTSNLGSQVISDICRDPVVREDAQAIESAIRPYLLKHFSAALLGRMTVVPYLPLRTEDMKNIVRLQLNAISNRLETNHRMAFVAGSDVVDLIAARCIETDSGARAADHILVRTLLPRIATELLAGLAEGRAYSRLEVAVENGDFHYDLT